MTSQTPAMATKKVTYRGVAYDIPMWMSVSTFLKRLREGQSFDQAVKPPMGTNARGRLGRAGSPYDTMRRRAFLMRQERARAGEDAETVLVPVRKVAAAG